MRFTYPIYGKTSHKLKKNKNKYIVVSETYLIYKIDLQSISHSTVGRYFRGLGLGKYFSLQSLENVC